MEGLGNKAQAIILAISAFLIALGTATATIPDFCPNEYKYQLAMVFWLCGIIGFALKELAGSSYSSRVQTDTS